LSAGSLIRAAIAFRPEAVGSPRAPLPVEEGPPPELTRRANTVPTRTRTRAATPDNSNHRSGKRVTVGDALTLGGGGHTLFATGSVATWVPLGISAARSADSSAGVW